MHPFAAGNVAAARRDVARCIDALRAATSARREDEWRLIGQALAYATSVQAQLDDAMTIDEMAATAGEDAAE